MSQGRSRTASVNSIIMVAVVLYILGLAGMISLHFNRLSTVIKERIQVTVFLKDAINEAATRQMQIRLEAEPFIRAVTYTSKAEAMEIYKKVFDDKVEDLLSYNPLPASFDLRLVADWMNADSLAVIEGRLKSKYGFSQGDLRTDRDLVASLDSKLGSLNLILIAISLVLFLVTVVLIDGSIKLTMYSHRFLIKNMQLVGATQWFVTQPYLGQSIYRGSVSGLLAVLAVGTTIYAAQNYYPALRVLQDPVQWTVWFILLILTGIGISWWSTRKAVRKYLKQKLDDLY